MWPVFLIFQIYVGLTYNINSLLGDKDSAKNFYEP